MDSAKKEGFANFLSLNYGDVHQKGYGKVR